MPQYRQYPGESRQEFLQRIAQQDPQSVRDRAAIENALSGGFGASSTQTLPFQTQPLSDEQFEQVLTQAIGQNPITPADLFSFPEYQRTPLADQPPGSVPYDVPNMEDNPRTRSAGESRGSMRGGSEISFESPVEMPPVAGQLTDFAFDLSREGAEQIADPRSDFWMVPRMLGQGSQRAVEFWRDYLFGPAEQPEPPDVPDPAAPFTGGGFGNFSGGLGVGSGGTEGQSFDRDVRLPVGGGAIADADVPRIDRDALDRYISRLEESAPSEFERQPTDPDRLLASVGQALAEAGQAPTLDQALLAAGTGGTTAIAENEARQDELARQAEMRQNEFDRMVAEAAFGGEQAVNQAERAAQELELRRDRIAAELENRQARAFNQMFDVQVSGDNIVIQQPKMNDDGTMTVETQIMQQGAQSDYGKIVSGDLSDMELPDIGGIPGQQRLSLMSNPSQRLMGYTAMSIISNDLAVNKVQDVTVPTEGGGTTTVPGQQVVQMIEQRAQSQLAQRLGLEPDASMQDITTAWNSAEPADYSAEEALEESIYEEMMMQMSRNPSFARAVLTGAGFGSQ